MTFSEYDASFCQCGIPQRRSRVIGGTDADLNEYPWQVWFALEHNNDWNTFTCGGSLISDSWIISAAHCFEGFGNPPNPKKWRAVLGDHDRSTTFEAKHRVYKLLKNLINSYYFYNLYEIGIFAGLIFLC